MATGISIKAVPAVDPSGAINTVDGSELSTRTVTPTSAGSAYYEHAARILSDLEEADRAVARLDESPRGPLRVSAPVAFGRMHVAPMVASYLARYPAVELYLNLSDALVNLVEDNVDVGTMERINEKAMEFLLDE